jgi:hypothetical protein
LETFIEGEFILARELVSHYRSNEILMESIGGYSSYKIIHDNLSNQDSLFVNLVIFGNNGYIDVDINACVKNGYCGFSEISREIIKNK